MTLRTESHLRRHQLSTRRPFQTLVRWPGLIAVVGLAFLATDARAHDPEVAAPSDTEHASLAEVGAKLSDPPLTSGPCSRSSISASAMET